jgi:hypothetical protein
MARSRNIKPGLFMNEVLGDKDPILTLLFIGLWTLADREGKLEFRPARIKAQIFPYRESLDINGYLTELASLEFVDIYTANNQQILRIKNFKKHQSPHKTEKQSDLPDDPENHKQNQHVEKLTVKTPLSNDTNRPDSLIPDSLIPDLKINVANEIDDEKKNNAKKKTEKQPSKFYEPAKEIAFYLDRKIKSENPGAITKPESWFTDIEKAIRIDKRSKEDLLKIIDWIYSPGGEFWKANILSGKKLREKFDAMYIKSQNRGRNYDQDDIGSEEYWEAIANA